MVYVVLAVLAAAAVFFIVRSRKSLASTVAQKGSAFARVAQHDASLEETKGKVIALRAAADAHNEAVAGLEKAAADVHSERDKIEDRLKSVAAAL